MPRAPEGFGRRHSFFPRSSVLAAQQKLRALPPLDNVTLRELVRDTYDDIVSSRERGVSWGEIHTALSKRTKISLRTLMLYVSDEERARRGEPPAPRPAPSRKGSVKKSPARKTTAKKATAKKTPSRS